MYRTFPEHDRRAVTDLAGLWAFAWLGDADPDDVAIAAITFDQRMAVPGCFDATPAYAGQRGLAAYRTGLLLADQAPHRLYLEGVHHWCRVLLDGVPLADHAGGFTRFGVDLVGLAPGAHELIVLVDNRYDYARCPLHLDTFDWYHYGGIARGAALHRLGRAWIEALHVVTVDWAARTLHLTLNWDAVEPLEDVPLVLTVDGTVVIEAALTGQGPGTFSRRITLPEAALWSPEAPALHTVYARLGEDDQRERFGIRQVQARDGQLWINGQPQRLLGFNRHESHPQFGHALPAAQTVADVQLLKDLGCNFVRTSHYPPERRFLDLCDEAGLCVWAEAIGWQHDAGHLADPHFMRAQLTHAREMLAACLPHPSVILWGILNESSSHDPACRDAYATLLAFFREHDPDARPVTYASMHPLDDLCWDLCDVIAINTYPGWYFGTLAELPAWLNHLARHVDNSGFARRPLILSEIGAGAIYGWRDRHHAHWSEEYQADLLDAAIQALFIDSDRWAGLAIWQFCDIRATDRQDRMLGRPRAFNNKGVIDEYRRPKLAYEVVRQRFRALRGS